MIRHMTGHILSYVRDITETIYIINPIDESGDAKTELHQCIKSRYPAMFASYKLWCRRMKKGINTWPDLQQIPPFNMDGMYIANFPFENLYNITPDRVEYGLTRILQDFMPHIPRSFKVIRLPYKMGIDDMSDEHWVTISNMLACEFADVQLEIWSPAL